MRWTNTQDHPNFNPRSHERSDALLGCFSSSASAISIHAPTRGATLTSSSISVPSYISIHAPTRGATDVSCNPVLKVCISIHAPTRGATERGLDFFEVLRISIHAPTRGATRTSARALLCLRYFNPRSHERSDVSFRFDVVILFAELSYLEFHEPAASSVKSSLY